MTASLATPADATSFLGLSAGTDTVVLQALLDGLEVQLQRETSRVFSSSVTPIVGERCNGTGFRYVYVLNPIAVLTAVRVGQDPANPWEVLTVTPTAVIVDPMSPRRIVRVDGARFWKGIGNVQVDYTPAAYLPADCKLALLEAVAMVYRRRGSEDAEQESTGMFSHKLLQDLRQLPSWAALRLRTLSIA